MTDRYHRIDVVLDNRKISTEAKDVELRIDGIPVYEISHLELSRIFKLDEERPENFVTFNVLFFLKAAKAVFGHPERYKIVISLKDEAKSFTEIQNSLSLKPATLDFHLKKLLSGMVVGKTDTNRYQLTVIGEALMDYFSEFLQKVEMIQRKIGE